MRKHNGKTHLNSEHILYLIFHMCQYSSVFFGNSTKIKYEKVCISPNNISNGYKIIKLITRFWEARREPDSKKREWFCMQCRNIFRNVRSFPDAGSLFHPSKKPGPFLRPGLNIFSIKNRSFLPPKNSPMPEERETLRQRAHGCRTTEHPPRHPFLRQRAQHQRAAAAQSEGKEETRTRARRPDGRRKAMAP